MPTAPPRDEPVTVHAADRLIDAAERAGCPACVGIDPVLQRLPPALVTGADASAHLEAIRVFSLGVLDAVAPHVPCVKLQSACYERYGHAGVRVLETLIGDAGDRGLQVILDAKRGDIGISAEHYAAAAFGPGPSGGDDRRRGPDWITVNAYLGEDGIRPFLVPGRGVFALVRTSNPGGDAVQAERLADGRTVADRVADIVASIGAEHVGRHGYSALGAVVGATRPEDAARLRAAMPRQVLLLPGFGAQGGSLDDVRACFDAAGRGAIVTASRSVIYAFGASGGSWTAAVADAARALAEEVGGAVGLR